MPDWTKAGLKNPRPEKLKAFFSESRDLKMIIDSLVDFAIS